MKYIIRVRKVVNLCSFGGHNVTCSNLLKLPVYYIQHFLVIL